MSFTTITNYIQNTINFIPDDFIFYVVSGICILEPVVSPIAIFTGLLLCYLKRPNFLDANEIYVLQRENMLKSIEDELTEDTISDDEVDEETSSNLNVTYDIIDNEPVINVLINEKPCDDKKTD